MNNSRQRTKRKLKKNLYPKKYSERKEKEKFHVDGTREKGTETIFVTTGGSDA